MADEPSLTRWSFQFGKKKATETKDEVANGHSNGNSSGVTSNGSGHVKNTSELAIYEQYQSQGQRRSAHSNGVSTTGFDEEIKIESRFKSMICDLHHFRSLSLLRTSSPNRHLLAVKMIRCSNSYFKSTSPLSPYFEKYSCASITI
ncbi:hypothetical protein LOK49_LG10G01825 [Camellia lanceoleosa]|uniref:Uncharacterized protein n=1 Tax=Camellia lanceoleosa TaxID=1840588 RepID=A0ACC0G7A5_9ERIC|nr:hypothetical protein LOK49_LG10G01825 [Camellia lanceoleosa]